MLSNKEGYPPSPPSPSALKRQSTRCQVLIPKTKFQNEIEYLHGFLRQVKHDSISISKQTLTPVNVKEV